ncbi:MAG: cytochrome c oxidase assembly protein, partial [Actinomycetota bacterium]|nr:cytochrome c oxidase assembly protein [Actinomycetota bacterium]
AHGRVPRPHARLAFFAGLGVVAIALTGPIDAAVTTSFSVHMIQHLLLTMIAAPLLLLGAPITLALQAWPGTPRGWLLATLRSAPARLLGNPLVAWALFFVVLWGIHFTGLYEAALRNDGLHALEHIALLVTALLFWMPIVRADPIPSGLSHPARILYLFVAMPAMAFLGLTIVSSRHVLYPAYAQADGVARALADQRAAGAIMWAGAMVLIVPALAFVLLDWMHADEREAARVDARLERATMRGA